jgi:hypothetical protein
MNLDELRDSLDELAGPAEPPTGSVVADLRRRGTRSRLVRRGYAVGTVVVVALVSAAVFFVRRDSSNPVRVQTPGSTATTAPAKTRSATTLRIPPLGRARATQLPDGTPVWIVHHNDGTATVVSAVSTHAPNGLHQLAAWCPSGRNFEDGMYGSTWDERGDRIGGPAPTGLPVADAQRTSHHRIRVDSLPATGSSHQSVAADAGIRTCFSNPPMGFDHALNRTSSAFETDPTTLATVASQVDQGTRSKVEYLPAAHSSWHPIRAFGSAPPRRRCRRRCARTVRW